jgi:hypothetical protein
MNTKYTSDMDAQKEYNACRSGGAVAVVGWWCIYFSVSKESRTELKSNISKC